MILYRFDNDVSDVCCSELRNRLIRMFENSNIVELFSILKKDDPDKQLVYYQVCCPLFDCRPSMRVLM